MQRERETVREGEKERERETGASSGSKRKASILPAFYIASASAEQRSDCDAGSKQTLGVVCSKESELANRERDRAREEQSEMEKQREHAKDLRATAIGGSLRRQ